VLESEASAGRKARWLPENVFAAEPGQ